MIPEVELAWDDEQEKFLIVVPAGCAAIDVTTSVLQLMADAWTAGAASVTLATEENPYAIELVERAAAGIESTHGPIHHI